MSDHKLRPTTEVTRQLFQADGSFVELAETRSTGAEVLQARGITIDTIHHFHITGYRNQGRLGWEYPVPDAIGDYCNKNRFKAADGQQPKYFWPQGKPDGATYYHPRGLAQAIAKNNGQVWLAAGESDVWAFYSAGISNVISWLDGESSVPSTLATDLQNLGVQMVLYAPDQDSTGTQSARKVATALQDTGIECRFYTLPGNDGYDVGDAWQQLTRNRDNPDLATYLLTLPQFTPAIIESVHRPTNSNEHDLFPAGFIDAVESTIQRAQNGKTYGNGQWWYVHCPNPNHQDENPSAGWNVEGKFCMCAACGETWNAKQTAALLGIRFEDYIPQSPQTTELPTRVREMFCQAKLSKVARVLDALYLSDLEPQQAYSTKEYIEACSPYGIGEKTVRQALQATTTAIQELGVTQSPVAPASGSRSGDCSAENLFISHFFRPYLSLHKLDGSFGKKIKNARGRPSKYYVLPSLDDVCALFGVNRETEIFKDPLPVEALASKADYRAAVMAAPITRANGKAVKYKRSSLAERVGVSNRTAQKYDKRAGIYSKQNTAPKQAIEPRAIANLPESRKQLPGYMWIEDDNGKRYPPSQSGARRALETTGGVWMVRQTANSYSTEPFENTSQETPAATSTETVAKPHPEPVYAPDAPPSTGSATDNLCPTCQRYETRSGGECIVCYRKRDLSA